MEDNSARMLEVAIATDSRLESDPWLELAPERKALRLRAEVIYEEFVKRSTKPPKTEAPDSPYVTYTDAREAVEKPGYTLPVTRAGQPTGYRVAIYKQTTWENKSQKLPKDLLYDSIKFKLITPKGETYDLLELQRYDVQEDPDESVCLFTNSLDNSLYEDIQEATRFILSIENDLGISSTNPGVQA